MSTLYSSEKIRALATTGDPFYRGAWWILRQQEAAQITGKPRASFMADKISMDEARAKVAEDYDHEWTKVPAPDRGMSDKNRATLARLRAEEQRRISREVRYQANLAAHTAPPFPNAADLGGPRAH